MTGGQARARVAVVGPVAPFRGGIAQHTTRLAEALSRLADVDVITFSRLYPQRLYPGRFQLEETRLEPTGSLAVHFALDSLWPPTWRRTLALIAERRPTCVIVPWWTFFLAPCLHVVGRGLRTRNIPLVFVCHNVVDHEAARWKRWLSRRVLQSGCRFLVHATEQRDELEALLGSVDVIYHPQPVFDQFPPAHGLLPRPAGLELLFYGFIRPYKGLQVLLDAMTRLADLDIHLAIVGEPWGADETVWRRRIDRAHLGSRVEFVPRYVSAAETAEYFHRADVVVLPYTSATGTAVAATAYHYGKPVIASGVGGLLDVVEDGVTGFLVPAGDVAALAAAIRRFAEAGLPQARARIARLKARMTWEHLAETALGAVPGTSAVR